MTITIDNVLPEEKETLEQLAKQFVESKEEPLFLSGKSCPQGIAEIIDHKFNHEVHTPYVIKSDGNIIGGAFLSASMETATAK